MPARALIEGKVLEFAAGAMPPSRDSLDAFTRAYIAAALELLADEDKERFENGVSLRDISPSTLKQMVDDCRKFQEETADILKHGVSGGMDDSAAGTDFWLTRSRSGAGFWDGDWPNPAGDQLTKTAHAYGEAELYVGDDNLIHQMGAEGDWQLKSFTPKNAKGGLIGSVKVTDTEPPSDPDAPADSGGSDDEDDLREAAEKLVAELLSPTPSPGPLRSPGLLKEDELEGGAEMEDAICPACEAMQPEAQARLGGLGRQVYYRCRYCGMDWHRSSQGPLEGNSPEDF